MTIQQAIEKAIEGGERNYMRKPQPWTEYSDGFSIMTVLSKGEMYVCRADTSLVRKKLNKFRWYIKDGYVVTSIKYKRVKMHHMVMGQPPEGKEIDHINRDRDDNRKSNLRFVSKLVNGQNKKAVGVRKKGNQWEANVCLNYKKYFKCFTTLKEAKEWRAKMKANFAKTL